MFLTLNWRVLATIACLASTFFPAHSSLEKSPKIISKGGNVILESGLNRNISIRLNGRSRLIVNDFDLLELLLGKDSQIVSVDEGDPVDGVRLRNIQIELVRMRNNLYGAGGFDIRLRRVENRTRGFSPVNMLRITQRRVGNLEDKYRKLIRQLRADNCASNPCANGGSCIGLFDSFVCKCTKGFEGPTCSTDVNECGLFAGTDLGCQNGAQCINQFGSYSCMCNSGWQGVHCNQRKTDCMHSSNAELCGHGTCVNSNDNFGYRCICEQGWKSNGLTPSCTVDIDECLQYSNPCATKCINLQGGFMCAPCDPGYTGNGLSCRDIDECATNNGGCSTSPFVPCINTFGSFHCGECPVGWAGDGRVCTRSDGASCRTRQICHPMALCQEIANSITCICPVGMIGNGVGPNGCSASGSNVCSSNPCLNGGTCMDTGNGMFTCLCPVGFRLPNCQRAYNPCATNRCQNGGTCRPRGNTFTCSCVTGYGGQFCESQRSRCGQYLIGEQGIMKYPLGDRYHHNAQCSWVIVTNETQVLNITFVSFDIEDSPECHFDWLQMHDGPTAASQLLGRFCGSKLPLNGNIITTTNKIYLWFKSDNSTARAGFELTWTTIDPICGGVLEFDSHATIASPGSPGNYPRNRDCRWHLKAPNTKRIKLVFFRLLIETHSDCSHDYLEITDAISLSQLEMFCNSSDPAPFIVPSNEIILHFHSDNAGTDLGFQIHASTVERIPGCGGTYTERNGDIISPKNFEGSISCEYVIRYPKGLRVMLKMTDFKMGDDDCIEVFDFRSDQKVFVGRWCGKMMMPTIKSTENEVQINYFSKGGTFQLAYKTICEYMLEGPSGTVTSPNYPSGYPPNERCTYEIVGDSTQVISLQFIDMDLENQTTIGTCWFDFILIYDGTNTTSMGPFCNVIPPQIVSTTSLLKIILRTDFSIAGRGFKANYTMIDTTEECGGILRKPAGEIRLPKLRDTFGYKHDLTCTWTIVAPQGYAIQISWLSFELEYSSDCIYDYVVVVSNAGTSSSEELSQKYCGETPPPTLLNPSNVMSLRFVSDSTDTAAGFVAIYNFVDESTLCGGTLFSSTGKVTSPNWPNEYPANLNCTWTIEVRFGYQIELIVEAMDLEESLNCTNDWLQIRNGGHATSPLIGTFCGHTIPRRFQSFTHQLYLNFRTNSQIAKSGFHVTWQITASGCGGALFTNQGTIASPGYPRHYENDAQCDWRITINEGSTISVIITDMAFEVLNTCSYDFLDFYDGVSASSRKIGTYCKLLDDNSPIRIQTTDNKALIRFKSDSSSSDRGFYLTYKFNCTRTIYEPDGIIESPNFGTDNNPDNVNCTWTIQAPAGNKIELDFLVVGFKERTDVVSPVYVQELGSNTVRKFLSSQRFVSQNSTVMVSLNNSVTYFRLEYVMRGCVSKFHRESGEFASPRQLNTTDGIECLYQIETTVGKAIELVITKLNIDDTPKCEQDTLMAWNMQRNALNRSILNICGRQENVTITSTGPTLVIVFRSKDLNAGKGFAARYRTVESKCGGIYKFAEGVIQSPNYPANYDANMDCEWIIEVAEHSTINITVDELDIEDSYECFLDSLAIHDGGDVRSNVLQKLCGDELPFVRAFQTTSNKALIVFESDADTEFKGFKISFKESCGRRYVINETDNIRFLGTGRVELCRLNIVATDESKHVTFTTTYVHLYNPTSVSSVPNNDCVMIFDGDLSNTTYSRPRAQFCSRHAPSVTSFGNALTIQLNTAFLDQLEGFYTVMDNHCGGTFDSVEGTFASPSYPLTYPVNIECIWQIKATEGNTLELIITNMDIDKTDDCNGDYLEVRETNSQGRLIGVFCGNDIPGPLTAVNGLWIKFSSDNDFVRSGFLAQYNYAYSTELNGPSGTIMSPNFPVETHSSHQWVIRVRRENVVMAVIDEFTQELEFYDAEGAAIPDRIVPEDKIVRSTTNILTILFKGGSFKLQWHEVSKEFIAGNKTSIDTATNCYNKVISLGNQYTTFSSPGYPHGYESNLNCSWILAPAELGYHAFVSFQIIDLEVNSLCEYDHVLIHSSMDMTNWRQLDKKCKKTSNSILEYSGDRFLKVSFRSDYGVNGTGFSATASTRCGAKIIASSGTINVTLYFRILWDCVWNIQVKPGRKIKLDFIKTPMPLSSSTCQTYLLLKNGNSEHSPRLGDGKYCTRNVENVPLTSSNGVYVKLHTELHTYPNTIMFSFQEVMTECYHTVNLDESNSSVVISSENYPNIPNPHSRCVWVFKAPADRIISVEFEHPIDLQPATFCDLEYVELHDGGSDLAPVIGRFCGKTVPNSQKSSGSMLRLTYFTDIAEPHIGFKANVSLGFCGGTYRQLNGVISSPWPFAGVTGRSNFTCEYRILVPEGHSINITIDQIELPPSAFCNDVNHLEVIAVYPMEEGRDESHTVCKTTDHTTFEQVFDINEVRIKYQVLSQNFEKDTFKIHYNSISHGCGQTFEASSGVLKTPGYISSIDYPTRCVWKIKVPKGRRIKLEFLDFIGAGSVNSLYARIVPRSVIANDFDMRSIIARFSQNPPSALYSSDNLMSIVNYEMPASSRQGYKMRFSSDEHSELCYENFHYASGDVQFSPAGNVSVFCRYEIYVAKNTTFALTVSSIELDGAVLRSLQACLRHGPLAVQAMSSHWRKVWFCENRNETIFRLPFPFMFDILRNNFNNMTSLNLKYARHKCGGVFTIGSQFQIRQPSVSVTNYGAMDCSWKVLPNPGDLEQFEVSLNVNFKLKCDEEYLTLHYDMNDEMPRLGRFCNQESAIGLNAIKDLFIEYHTSNFDNASSFNLTAVVGAGCGGELTYPYRSIEFRKQYQNNIECIWTIRAGKQYHIGLQFTGRFFIESSANCTKDYILIQELVGSNNGDEWRDIQRICGREPPAFVNTTTQVMRFIFRSDESGIGDGFTANFQRNCGGIYNATSNIQILTSPNYPLAYDSNSTCNYTIYPLQTDNAILVRITDFSLEDSPKDNCEFDNLTVYIENEDPISLCGINKHEEFRSRRPITLVFKSDGSYNTKGFSLEYGVENCGGIVTQSTEISTPKLKQNRLYPPNTVCVWNITAPNDFKIIVKFEEFSFEGAGACSYDYVELFTGKVPSEVQRLARLCGNLTGKIPPITINWKDGVIRSTSDATEHSMGFTAYVTMVKDCDKIITLKDGTEVYDFKEFANGYENNMDCTFLFKTPAGYSLNLAFDHFHVEDSKSCHNDYLEVRDGNGPFADEIGRFCGHVVPRNITSSGSTLYLHFVSDISDTSTGFSATVSMVRQVCGAHELVIKTNETVVIAIGDEGKYLPNMNCFWRIRSDNNIRLDFDKFDLQESLENGTCTGDFLRISNRQLLSSSETIFGSTFIFNGEATNRHIFPYEPNEVEHTFCGSEHPNNYYTNSREVFIKFFSDSSIEKSGFKLLATTIDVCLKNFSASQGRVQGELAGKCDIYINAPQNYSISIYFEDDLYANYINNLEIFDIRNNNLTSTWKSKGFIDPQSSVFTNSSQILLKYSEEQHTIHADFTFLASNQGPGCGGDLYNTRGIFTSPFYPSQVRETTNCRWNIKVPNNMLVFLEFRTFDMGSKVTCHSDYLQILELEPVPGSNNRTDNVVRQFCGGDTPTDYTGRRNILSVRFRKSVNFNGLGWVIRFYGVRKS